MTSTPASVAVAACGAHWEAAALAEIESDSCLELVRRCVDIADLLATASARRLDLALLSVTSPGLDAEVVDRLLELGVRPCAVESSGAALGIAETAQLGQLAALAARGSDPPAAPSGRGRTVAVWGPTGAPGRSTLAVSLAAAAAADHRVALVDADVNGGSIAQLLGVLDDVSGLMAACREVTLGRPPAAETHLLAVGPTWNLLTGVPRADMWPHLRPESVESVLRGLRRAHELVVVDCGFGLDPGSGVGVSRDLVTRRVLEFADDVVVVGRADPVGLARLVRGLVDAEPWRRPPRLVINGFRSSLGWTEHEVATTVRELTGHRPWGFLPQDQSAHDQALMSGRPVPEAAPSSPYAVGVQRLAAELATPR